ncbi:MAG TPA: hypothetical protein VHA11_10275 [Bryobacteraceae bacterium]|nr:hypothetical protein [Bryobacteraceae bacterium]
MENKPRFDPNSPEIKAYLDEVNHTFTREGTLVACETCMPGMTVPIAHDESRITALDGTADGAIYGGTSGHASHLFVACFHGLSGLVFDLGTVAGATGCAAVCCGASRLVAFVNGPGGGRAIGSPLAKLTDQDFIQEWSIERPALTDHGACVPGEAVVDAVSDPSRKQAIGVTPAHLFTLDIDSPKVRVAGAVPQGGKIAVGSAGGIFGRDEGGSLWRYDPQKQALQRRAVKLPEGDWSLPLVWARDPHTGLLYTAEAQGRLFSFDERSGFSAPLGRTPLAPAGPMAVTFDGRLFGFCGAEIAKQFCYNPARREVSNLGVAASVIGRRRYGYVFGAAVTGRDGEIVFGEDDNGGHLWLYFPRIASRA